jgi:hypothetical protein
MSQPTWPHKYGSLELLRGHLLRLMGHWLLIVFLLLGGGLLGCSEITYKATELYGWNCRPGKQVNGRCVASR